MCASLRRCMSRRGRDVQFGSGRSGRRSSTPPEFRFAVKLPRTITHERGLAQVRDPLVEFLDQTEGLAEKRGPVLVQLPPSLVFDESIATRFFELIRGLYLGALCASRGTRRGSFRRPSPCLRRSPLVCNRGSRLRADAVCTSSYRSHANERSPSVSSSRTPSVKRSPRPTRGHIPRPSPRPAVSDKSSSTT